MNRTHRVVRASFYLSLALPLAALACGQSFTAGPGEDAGTDGQIVFGDGGENNDATADARHDGPSDGGSHDGTVADGKAETGPTCPVGSVMCSDGGCVPESPTNCGSCGNDCTMLPHVTGAQCTSGQCSVTCASGWQNCTSNPNAGCQANTNAQGNCGGCGITCSGSTPVCSGGSCVSGCSSGQMLCNGTCVNTATDPQNCGGCGMMCPNNGPTNSQPTCTNSTCAWACEQNYRECTGSPSTCVLNVPDAGVGVFVAPGFGNSSCGAPTQPCGNIMAGLQALTNGENTVYVAEGTYQTQLITLPAGVTISGGWVYQGGAWTRDCASPSKTIIQAPVGNTAAVVTNYSSNSSTLDTLTISDPNSAASGQSLYGVFASNPQATAPGLTLTNVAINVAAAGSGVDGTQGDAGSAPAASCTGVIAGGGNGGNGGLGAVPDGGFYNVNGYQPQTGGTGPQGQPGISGVPAPVQGQTNGPTCVTAYSVGGGSYNTDQACCTDNTGGANFCGTCSGGAQPLCGSPGTNGCGSGGSYGGTGGTGGGSSVGVFAYNFGLTLNQVTITTGNGGNGGDGGTGGGTVGGSTATPGQPGTSAYQSCNLSCGALCFCAATGTTVRGNAGAAGGNGGMGGTGGQGAGGSGGDSVCYATAGSTTSVSPTGVTCNAGTYGVGGNASLANHGPHGLQGVHN